MRREFTRAQARKTCIGSNRMVVMLGPSEASLGGIAAVIEVYRRQGLFDRWAINFIETYRDGTAFGKAWAAVQGFSAFLWLLILGQVAVVHAHSASRASFWRKSVFLLAAMVFRRPAIFHLHGGGFESFYANQCGALAQGYVRFVLDHCAIIVVVSERWRGVMRSISSKPTIVCIPNPVQVDPADDVGVGPGRSGRVVLFLGRLEAAKGAYVLLEAFSRLRHRIPDCRLVLAGNGEVDNVRAAVRELGLDHSVEVPGWVGPVVKEQLLREASVLALPSFAEALPMSLLEAMAHGVPVVATPVGAIPEIIDRWRCGVLVPAGDAGLLEAALVRLLDSAEIRQQMGRAGRQAYERDYRADVVVPRLDAIYEQLGAFRDVHARGDSRE